VATAVDAARTAGVPVGVEAGLRNVGAAERWLASGLENRCARALLEVQSEDPVDVAHQLLRLGPAGIEILLHGEGSACWDVLRIAVSEGVASRIGLEDRLILPDGSSAPGNAALVTAALGLWPDTP
jgi:hypothetical protein